MRTYNAFVFELNNRLQDIDKEKRQRVVSRILADLEQTDIFTPLHELSEEEFWDEEFENAEQQFEAETLDRERRVRELQKQYNVEPDEEETEEEKFRRKRYGQTDLHEAVSVGDLEMIRKLVSEGADVKAKNNSGQTPIHLAFLEENQKVIELFRELGCIGK